MRPLLRPAALLAAALLAACGHGPNIRPAHRDSAPPVPQVRYPDYNPYSPYGEANAIWRPTLANRDGTIVRPFDPSTQGDRPLYEQAPWATDATAGSTRNPPPGTF